MRVHRSNRVERLFDALVDVVSSPLPDPLQPECIVVNSRGMNTWLSMQLANRLGVWAGGQFPFPRRFIDDLFATVNPQGPAWRDPDQLLWPLLAELPTHLHDPAFGELQRFVAGDPTGRNLFQLARRIATMFDQYPVFRPEMVLGWDAGVDEHWQAVLWRAVTERIGGQHVATQAQDFIDALEDRDALPPLPARVCVFGVSTLPPFYVHVLQALDAVLPVHLFIVSPSQEYWAEVRTRSTEDDFSDGVPPLLLSLGGVGREFQGVLETVDYQEGDSLYDAPGEQTMLAALQTRLLDLQGPEAPRHEVDPQDHSIALHACHSPMREVEVLHDQLLAMLAADPTLQPRDIVVLLTDVEIYAPLVEAVFERDEQDPSFIPFCVADRSVRAENPLVEAFHRVLDMVGGRVTASEVLDLLTLGPIQTRFGIAPDELDTLGGWVDEAGIRWGIDATHRKAQGQPALEENTWRFGLARLFLGFAMPGARQQTYADVLPYDEIEGRDASLLGRFGDLCEALFTVVTTLQAPRSPAAWQDALTDVLDRLLVAPEDGATWDVQPLRTAIDTIAAEASAAAFEDDLTLEAMLELIDARLEADAPPRGFLARGVTFCAMLPMRSVPFRVVCMVGLSDGAFPRGTRALGFDLIAAAPKPGDRSRRADDRYLFLEAVLAARERIHLSYVGQSIQDNADLPPSVVVSDLIDQLGACLQPPAPHEPTVDGVRDHLRLRHPMQPFSPRYFGADDDPRLFSYSRTYCDGARALVDADAQRARPPLLTAPLPDPREAPEAVTQLPLSRLLRFYKMPVADLVKRRLGVFLEAGGRDYSDREPMEVRGLDEWVLGDTLLQHARAELPEDTSLDLVRAEGLLPLGTPGACKHEEMQRAVSPLLAALDGLGRGTPLPQLELDLPLGPTRLVGTLGDRWPQASVRVQYAKLGAKHQLTAWIEHLCLCVAAPEDQQPVTVVLARGKEDTVKPCTFGPVPDAADALSELCALFWIGQREPVLLFPGVSLAYAETLYGTDDPQQAQWKAERAWTPNSFERNDPHVRRLCGDDDVLHPGYTPFEGPLSAGDFGTVATRVFWPMLQARSLEVPR
ncbi:MAG: exodeoxyribonuclease V subunit gamma [Myxococcota bacterium]